MKKLKKSSDKMISGVLGGFAEYYEIDPVWIRIVYVILAIVSGFWIAFFVYIAAAIIIPNNNSEIIEEKTNVDEIVKVDEPVHIDANIIEKKITSRKKFNLIIGLGLIIIGFVFLFNQLFQINIWEYIYFIYNGGKYYAWAVLLIVFGLLIILKGKK